ncbi:flagellar hook-length control protein FliK [Pseudomonas sp. CCI4.2]|uniref:flagellar hook-length control protein FliK n=1 Tax=Pseudomonas sp. CCI4.2 TaxID=3048620 RepID=UPI002AC9095E|nr:flagellar hook-length control protein FliK [Pseudomonas sp. CCI4.2]MEB0094009.1 flagellar hook-length control protein FliK [Pseudomonas sp. CCI4.2]WPX53561.1 flagellar hook-length control protein FliK [Pseudomonas sp. CCI4.2]
MTGDISSLPPLSPAAVLIKAGVAPSDVLKLLQPAAGLLAAGEIVTAEVVTTKPVDQAFQLLLRLNLVSGGQTLIQAISPQPLPVGANLLVSQPTPSSLAITVQQSLSSAVASLLTIDTKQLPVGTLLQGTVQSSQPLPLPQGQGQGQPALFRNIITLINTVLAGTSLTVDSPQPLAVGSQLNAQIQGPQFLSFVQLSTHLDQVAVSQQLSTQQSRQGSLDGLFKVLQNIQQNQSLPPALQESIDTLLADLPDIQQLSDPKVVAQALSGSGVFLEANLLGGQTVAAGPDLKANLLRLIAQILPNVPDNTDYDAAAAANSMARVMPSIIRNALGTLGLVGARPHLSGFPIPSRHFGAENAEDLETLLKLTAAAISRLQSHQLSGLEQTRTSADGSLLTTWQLEIPMRNMQDIVPLQVKVQREETSDQDQSAEKSDNPNKPAKEKLWRVELAFNLEPLGPLQVQAQLVRGSLSSQLWAERSQSAELIGRELGYLRERLVASGITVSELACHRGTPPQGQRTALEQRWIDEKA